jgi:predicted nucleic acid-binding protein
LLKVAIDTNILAYAEGIDDATRQAAAKRFIRSLDPDAIVIPIQALGELYNVLVRKGGWPGSRAREAVVHWRNGYTVAPTTEQAIVIAVDVAADHRIRIWDGVMLAVAVENDCPLLASEDFQDGFTWRGVTVANPFAAVRHPLLEAVTSRA